MALHGISYIRRTFYYLRRNGLRRTWHAVRERLGKNGKYPYEYVPPVSSELKRQREEAQKKWESGEFDAKISIVVPTYRTAPRYLRELTESVQGQSYPYWELIFADATEDDRVWDVVSKMDGVSRLESVGDDRVLGSDRDPGEEAFGKGRVVYLKLSGNKGISENTNAALPFVTGNYVGLLDHDDVLTKDALFEVAKQISKAGENGIDAALIFSDEDKCDEDQRRYYEPNCKEKFNLDLILSNNYICHFMVIKSSIFKALGLRGDYDGAQDYDLILRVVDKLRLLDRRAEERRVLYVPKVLYHWRCHAASTAENPRSKQYAYDAGLRALQDFADRNGMQARAEHQRHLGFYRIVYGEELFLARKDLGVVGGRVLFRGKIAGGRMDEEGNVYYEGVPGNFSGYLHRAVLTQDAAAVDIRCMSVRDELHLLFKEIVGVPYACRPGEAWFDKDLLEENVDYKKVSLEFCKAVQEKGYRILWLPERTVEI